MDYYKIELQKLKDSEYLKTIVLSDEIGNKTKHLSLTIECIESLTLFLKEEKKRLKKLKKRLEK